MNPDYTRPWCAKCQFEGKAEFIAGTFFTSDKAPQHEVDAQFNEFIDGLLPSRPKLIAMLPGSLIFVGEK